MAKKVQPANAKPRKMGKTAALAAAAKRGKAYYKGQHESWVVCDWDPVQQIEDNCKPISANKVPKAWGGNGP